MEPILRRSVATKKGPIDTRPAWPRRGVDSLETQELATIPEDMRVSNWCFAGASSEIRQEGIVGARRQGETHTRFGTVGVSIDSGLEVCK